jgi:Transposase DDE domain
VVADLGDDDGAAVQTCAAQGVTVDLPIPQPAAHTKLGLCGQEGLPYTPAQEVAVGPAGATSTDRVGTAEKGRTLRDSSTAACGRCALKAHCPRHNGNRRMTRGAQEDVLERRPPRLENHPELRRKRRAMVEPPVGTIKRWMDQGSCLRRGKPTVRTERRWSLLASTITRVLTILGVKAMLEALA